MCTMFKHLKMVYEICMRPNLPLKNLLIYVILTLYNHIFGPEAYMIYGTITENYTTETWSGGGVVDNTLDYQSRGRKIDPPLLRSFG